MRITMPLNSTSFETITVMAAVFACVGMEMVFSAKWGIMCCVAAVRWGMILCVQWNVANFSGNYQSRVLQNTRHLRLIRSPCTELHTLAQWRQIHLSLPSPSSPPLSSLSDTMPHKFQADWQVRRSGGGGRVGHSLAQTPEQAGDKLCVLSVEETQ